MRKGCSVTPARVSTSQVMLAIEECQNFTKWSLDNPLAIDNVM